MNLQLTTDMNSDFSNETLRDFSSLPNQNKTSPRNFPSLTVPHFISLDPTLTSLCEEWNCVRA